MIEYTADFETHKNPRSGVMSVWAWAICEVNNINNVIYGNNIFTFINALKELPKGSRVGFHNLKYDGSYILNTLLNTLEYQAIENKKDRKAKTVCCLISDKNVFYSIDIYFTKKHKVHLFDTLKLFNFSVKRIAESFNLPIKKGEIDYDTYRGEWYEMTREEKDYIKNDVQIVAMALKQFREQGLKKETIAGCALTYYKENFYYNIYRFNERFPHIDDNIYNEIKYSYRGGYVYCNPIFQGRELQNGVVLDINSLYPFVMSSNKFMLPIGNPERYEGEYKKDLLYPLYIQFFSACFELKKGKIPTIQIKGGCYGFNPNEYVVSSKGMMINLCLTSVDLELFKECYNIIEIKYIYGYKFVGCDTVFKEYVEHFSKMKIEATEEHNSGKRTIAKLLLNSLYGKFGANNNPYIKVPYIEDNILKFKTVISQTPPKTLYLPIASFITAYARSIIQRAYIDNLNRVAYCDTDSLHLIGNEIPDNLDIHSTRFGAFDIELEFKRAKFLGAKCYIEEYEKENETKIKVTCAGLSQDKKVLSQVTFENFEIGQEYNGMLKSRQSVGGVELLPKEYKLKPRLNNKF